MIEPTVIVWDLETIPDLDAAARMLGMTDAPPADVREALGDKFPKQPLHKIVCIGALITTRELDGLVHPLAWRAAHRSAQRDRVDRGVRP